MTMAIVLTNDINDQLFEKQAIQLNPNFTIARNNMAISCTGIRQSVNQLLMNSD